MKEIICEFFDKGEIVMASLSGVGGSSYVSSLYNSSNIISGLASGMDTESMIEKIGRAHV